MDCEYAMRYRCYSFTSKSRTLLVGLFPDVGFAKIASQSAFPLAGLACALSGARFGRKVDTTAYLSDVWALFSRMFCRM